MAPKKNKAAQAMARKRWRQVSPAERSAAGRHAAQGRWQPGRKKATPAHDSKTSGIETEQT